MRLTCRAFIAGAKLQTISAYISISNEFRPSLCPSRRRCRRRNRRRDIYCLNREPVKLFVLFLHDCNLFAALAQLEPAQPLMLCTSHKAMGLREEVVIDRPRLFIIEQQQQQSLFPCNSSSCSLLRHMSAAKRRSVSQSVSILQHPEFNQDATELGATHDPVFEELSLLETRTNTSQD